MHAIGNGLGLHVSRTSSWSLWVDGPAATVAAAVLMKTCVADMATICWASTSTGLAGTRSDSIAPARQYVAVRKERLRIEQGPDRVAKPVDPFAAAVALALPVIHISPLRPAPEASPSSGGLQ